MKFHPKWHFFGGKQELAVLSRLEAQGHTFRTVSLSMDVTM